MFQIIKNNNHYRVQYLNQANEEKYISCDIPNIWYTKQSLNDAIHFANNHNLQDLTGTVLNNFFLFTASMYIITNYSSILKFMIGEYGHGNDEDFISELESTQSEDLFGFLN